MQDAMQKQFVIDAVEENRNNIALLGDNIFYFAELGMQEYRTSGMMTEILEQAGFEIERNISGMPTAFIATYGSGTPVVALHTEFDATPSSSQMAGVAEQRPIVDGAPGHTEGHNVNAAVMIGAAVAVKKTMEQFDIEGTLRIYGAPAEEQLVSRPYFVRDGYFKDVDVALHDHIGSNLGTVYGLRQYALISAEFTFKGESAHAATSPWTARDALDAVVLMDIGWDKLREHLEPSQRSHRVITNGGDQPNVIPNTSTIWWFFREATAEKARALFEKAKRVAQGAATMTDTTYSVNVLSAVAPTRCNRTLAEVIQKNIEAVGMPQWSEAEQKLITDVQTKVNVKATGMPTAGGPAPGSRAIGVSQRLRGRLLGGAVGCGELPLQHSGHRLPPLGRGRLPGHLRGPQGSGCRRQDHGRVGRRPADGPGIGGAGQGDLQGRDRRRGVPPAAA